MAEEPVGSRVKRAEEGFSAMTPLTEHVRECEMDRGTV